MNDSQLDAFLILIIICFSVVHSGVVLAYRSLHLAVGSCLSAAAVLSDRTAVSETGDKKDRRNLNVWPAFFSS